MWEVLASENKCVPKSQDMDSETVMFVFAALIHNSNTLPTA